MVSARIAADLQFFGKFELNRISHGATVLQVVQEELYTHTCSTIVDISAPTVRVSDRQTDRQSDR